MTRIANQSAFVFRQLRAAWNRDCTDPRVDRLTAELVELVCSATSDRLILGLYRPEAIPTLCNLGSHLLSHGVGLTWERRGAPGSPFVGAVFACRRESIEADPKRERALRAQRSQSGLVSVAA